MTAALLAAAVCLPSPSSAQARGAQPTSPKVPVVPGLITANAVHEPDKGDYESVLRVSDVAEDGVVYTVSGNIEDRRISVRRKVRKQDWAHAHEWHPSYNEGDPEVYPGTTGDTLSADVLNDLKTRGQTTLKASVADNPVGGLLNEFLGGAATPAGTLSRVEPQPVPVSMLVNDVRVDLPAVHGRGRLGNEAFEVFILDDPAIPMVLRWSLADTSSRIKEIGDIMAKNPSWKLGVEGHTDNIGGAAANQDLSRRRAAAVRQALVDRYHVAPGRLTPAGFGASRPKETNHTLEGRARNRRVELARQPGV